MLAYFPTPRPGELLYGLLARFHQNSRNPSIEHTSMDICGMRFSHASRLFATNLEFLSTELDPNSILSPELFIQSHTLLPLFRPFVPPERVERAISMMMGSKKGSFAHSVLGINPNRMPPIRFLKYCPVCVKEDIESMQDDDGPTWYRSHQVQGVTICSRHMVWLHESSLSVPNSLGKRRYELPLESQAGEGQSATTHPFFEHYKFLADSVNWLLSENLAPSKLKSLADRYANLLKKQGLVTWNGIFRQKEIVEKFVSFYGHDFLEEMNSTVRVNQSHSWLNDMLRPSPYRMSHPCQHLLVMRAFGISPRTFFSKKKVRSQHHDPFGQRPWPCLNKASDHYREPKITICEIQWREGHYRGFFKCEDCGYSYNRIGPEKHPDERYQHSRVHDFGPVWREYVYNRCVNEGISLRQVSRELDTCHQTIKRQINSIHENVENPTKKVITDEMIRRKEKVFLCILKENPKITRTELYEGKPYRRLTRWHYRYNRDWLKKNMPPAIPPERKSTLKDWDAIDRTLAPRVRLACIRMLKHNGYPIRITKAAIIRQVGNQSAIYRQLSKLPKTKKYLKERLEINIDQYRSRVLQYKAMNLVKEGRPITRWTLLRSMGLAHLKLSDDLERAVKSLVDCHSSRIEK